MAIETGLITAILSNFHLLFASSVLVLNQTSTRLFAHISF